MRHVSFSPEEVPPGQETFWESWKRDAATVTENMVERDRNDQPFSPDKEQIWKRLRDWFLTHVFAGKCAYCEGDYNAGAPTHAEHWRPKNKVTHFDGEREIGVERDGVPHPGYWWLAYCWENLVPSCFRCNTGKGKGNKFPIAGDYAFSPQEGADVAALNEAERPWLLHPFSEPKPEDHIGFYPDGTAFAKDKSPYGRWTITVMDLNRDVLVDKRRERQTDAVDAFAAAASDSILHDDVDLDERMRRWDDPGAEFSRAVEDRLLPIRKRVGPQVYGR